MRPNRKSVPQAGGIQAEFVRYQGRLARIRILECLIMYELVAVLRTRPPVGEEGEDVERAEVADPNASHLNWAEFSHLNAGASRPAKYWPRVR